MIKNKNELLKSFISLALNLQKIPTRNECTSAGLDRHSIDRHFGSKTALDIEAVKKDPKLSSYSMNNKENVIAKYIDICFKLGKIASMSDCIMLGLSNSSIDTHYGNITNLKTMALAKHPELERLTTPPKLVTNEIESYRLKLEKNNNKKHNNVILSNASTLDYIENYCENIFKGRILPLVEHKKHVPIERIHTLVLSDLHFGADIEAEETNASNYGILEESRRFSSIIKEASLYKEQYQKNTHLNILLLGDIIENQLHDPRTGAVIAEQCARAIHLLIQGIAYLSQKYPTVTVRCATGNHGRNTQRHQQRAIHQKWDSLETIIYYSVKTSCSNLKNVSFDIPKSPIASYDAFGKKIGYTHGDSVIRPGNPGSTVNVRDLEQQVNKFNASLPDKEEYSVIIYGHTHTAHVVYLSNGTVLIGNGSLPPPDPFAVSIGVLESNNTGQWIMESVKGHAVGDLRYLKAGKEYDKDDSLDKLIQPWKAF